MSHSLHPESHPGRARSAMRCAGGIVLAILFVSGCGDNHGAEPDAGGDPIPAPDAGLDDVDAAPPDDVDAGVTCPVFEPTACSDEQPCAGAGEGCVAGICVASCGQDIDSFTGALGAGVKVVANVCVAPGVRGVHVGESAGCERITVYDLANDTNDDGDLELTLSSFVIDPAVVAPTVGEIGSTLIDVTQGSTAFPGAYLAINPGPAGTGNTAALVGYSESGAGFPGEVVRIAIPGGDSDRVVANGNYSVAWIDESRYLINGLSAGDIDGGQGLYHVDVSGASPVVTHVVTGLGDFSGSVGVDATNDIVFAGGFFQDDGDLVFAIPLADIEAAVASGTPLDAAATADIQRFAIPSTFELLGDRFASMSFASGALEQRRFSVAVNGTATEVSVDDAELLASPPFSAVSVVGSDRALLHHEGGSLLVTLEPAAAARAAGSTRPQYLD